MENVILKVVLILVVLSGLAWGLQKLFPPTQKDIEQAEQRAKELQARMDAKVGAAPAAPETEGESTGQTKAGGL